MKKALRKCMAMFMASLCLLMTFATSTAFAAENDTDDVILDSNNTIEDAMEGVIEDIDPNIQVVVTELPEDYNMVMPLDLRRTDTYFKFTSGMTGKVRYYRGNHFSVDLTTSSPDSGNFTLKLVRTDGINTTVGKANLPKNGSFHVEFLNVNKPGNYRFDFDQGIFAHSSQEGTMTIWDWD